MWQSPPPGKIWLCSVDICCSFAQGNVGVQIELVPLQSCLRYQLAVAVGEVKEHVQIPLYHSAQQPVEVLPAVLPLDC